MRTLKAICIVFCLLSVVSVLTGIRSFHWSTSDGLNITRQGGLINTLWSVFSSLLYATAAYAIHRRIPVVWKLARLGGSHCLLSGIHDWRSVFRTEATRRLDWRCRDSSWGRIGRGLLGPLVEPAKRLLPHCCAQRV